MKKRILSVLLVICMIVPILPLTTSTAFAKAEMQPLSVKIMGGNETVNFYPTYNEENPVPDKVRFFYFNGWFYEEIPKEDIESSIPLYENPEYAGYFKNGLYYINDSDTYIPCFGFTKADRGEFFNTWSGERDGMMAEMFYEQYQFGTMFYGSGSFSEWDDEWGYDIFYNGLSMTYCANVLPVDYNDSKRIITGKYSYYYTVNGVYSGKTNEYTYIDADRDSEYWDRTYVMVEKCFGSTVEEYSVTCNDCTHGSLSVVGDSTGISWRDTVNVTVTPDSRYVLDGNIYVYDSNGTSIAYCYNDGSGYYFSMPRCDVSLSASFKIPVSGVELNKDSTTLKTGEEETLTTTVSPSDATYQGINWSSSNKNVATVDNAGKITAVGAGTTTITATSKDNSSATDTCTVTVLQPVTGITFNKSKTSLKVGDTETLSATVAPENANDKSLVWSSDTESVATVDQNGKITAVALGTATITATNTDSGKSATCTVNVVSTEDVDGAGYYSYLALYDNIDVGMKIKNFGSGFSLSKLAITVDGEPLTLTEENYSKGVVDVTLAETSPKDMDKGISIVVTYDGVVVKNTTYNIRKYCEAVFNTAGYGVDSDLGKMCKSLLNYGAWAENYYNEENDIAATSTINKDYEIDFSKITVPDAPAVGFKAGNTITGAGASLNLNSRISISFYVYTTDYSIGGVSDVKFVNNLGQKVTDDNIEVNELTEKGVKVGYEIVLKNLSASKLSRFYTLTLRGIQASEFSVTYGVNSYCNTVSNDKGDTYTDTLKTLCKAIYNYSAEAKAYATK